MVLAHAARSAAPAFCVCEKKISGAKKVSYSNEQCMDAVI
jgi:hypothetical protein